MYISRNELGGTGEILESASYLNSIVEGIKNFPLKIMEDVVTLIENTASNDGVLFIAGNGGSASTASHFATDLSVGTYKRTGKKIKAWSLVDNAGIITATANDLSFDEVFREQLKVHATSKDILILISASGNSSNLISAVEYAKNQGILVVAITGFDGGKLAHISDISLHFETGKNLYGVTEDLHSICCHLIAERLRQ